MLVVNTATITSCQRITIGGAARRLRTVSISVLKLWLVFGVLEPWFITAWVMQTVNMDTHVFVTRMTSQTVRNGRRCQFYHFLFLVYGAIGRWRLVICAVWLVDAVVVATKHPEAARWNVIGKILICTHSHFTCSLTCVLIYYKCSPFILRREMFRRYRGG